MKLADTDLHLLEALWDYLCIDNELPNYADAIVVGGSGKMVDGADRAAELYHDGISKCIIVSGFNNPYLTSGNESEAVILRDRLVKLDVPLDVVITDESAENTGENVLNAAKILSENKIEVKNIILVHKPYMTRRFLATARAQWPSPQPKFYVTCSSYSMREYYQLYESTGETNKMVELMIGDYERIKDYPARGLTIAQPYSEKAERAYQQLKARGFAGKEMRS